MKAVLGTVAALGVGGATYFGMDGPDYDRVINRTPIETYAAFSALAQEGVITQPRSDGVDRQVTLHVTKQRGDAIHYEIRFDDRPVVEADLTFEPSGEGGRQTRMTAELEIDAYELGSAFETDGGMALSLVPDSLIDMQFATFMEDMARDVEAGRPLPALALNRAGIREQSPRATLSGRRHDAERAREAAVRPMRSARPMVDPNEAARNFREGAPEEPERGRPGGWGR